MSCVFHGLHMSKTMTLQLSAAEIAKQAREASHIMQSATAQQKTKALNAIYHALLKHKLDILAANELDLKAARAEVEAGKLSSSLVKRLDLSSGGGDKYISMAAGVLDVDKLEDPTGKITYAKKLDENLELYRVSCPIGVLLIIFEARPEVVVQISALAIKSGNVVILKGGKEAHYSNAKLFEVLQAALATTSLPKDAVQLVESREDINALLSMDRYIDLVIPRGSKQLVQFIQGNTRIPVLGHADGICTVYVDKSADISKSIHVIVDSKTNYPAACNAAETLLIHASAVPRLLYPIATALLSSNVTLHCDSTSYTFLTATPTQQITSALQRNKIVVAGPDAYDTEFLDLDIAVKIVDNFQDAIIHINCHGSKHTEVIITEDKDAAEIFMNSVDAAGVYWNASSRFADGFRYGFGAEIGVSTNKTHARGPVGLEGLVIYKYRLFGDGQGAGDFGTDKKAYLHSDIVGNEKYFMAD
ncbi:hypothetical protein HK096_005339 [Nowakowskiella sp. JEL0078]|nr:hypothetical protein HK096_005339 [Nowakowskiella sp. JEL0078]